MIHKIRDSKFILGVFLFLLLFSACTERKKQIINQLNAESLRFYKKGDLEKAIPKGLEALRQSEKIFGKESAEYAIPLTNLGLLYLEQGNAAVADSYLFQAYTLRKNILGESDPKTLISQLNLSEMYRKTKRYVEAESEARVVINFREKLLAPNDTELARAYYALANTYFVQAKYPSAGPDYEKALAIMDDKPTRFDNQFLSNILVELGMVYKKTGRIKESIPLYERAILLDKKIYGGDHPNIGMSMVTLADSYFYAGNPLKAEEYYNEGLKMLQTSFDPRDPMLIPLYERVANFCEKTGKPQKAAEFRARVKQIKGESK